MFKYIGIRGHRGAGKNTISYLIGAALDFYTRNNSWEGFDKVYKDAVERVMENEIFLAESEFKNVYFESFADTVKVVLSQITGIPSDMMYDDKYKETVIVDLKDFSYFCVSNEFALNSLKKSLDANKKLYVAQELAENVIYNGPFYESHEHIYITLRELIAYYSKYIMQVFFGKDVWIKSLEKNKFDSERFYAQNKTIYKIFVDCKFPSEISYIYNNKGVVIKVNRENNQKADTNYSCELENDNRYDFEINLDGNLLNPNTIEDIKRITLKIISNDKNNNSI